MIKKKKYFYFKHVLHSYNEIKDEGCKYLAEGFKSWKNL